MADASVLPDLLALPELGVGASLSFGVQPDPVALAARRDGPSFVEYAAPVQPGFLGGALARLKSDKVPLLYHPSCLNLCGTKANPAPWVDEVRRHVQSAGCPWLAQDVGVCFTNDEGGYSNQLGYFIAPVLTQASLDVAVDRVVEVKAQMDVPLLLEPPPVTFTVGDMGMFEWLNALAQRTDSGLLIDAGHVVAHQLVAGRTPENLTDGLDVIDFDRVVEMHIAGGALRPVDDDDAPLLYLDAHDLPILPETWQVFRFLLEHTPHLKAVCVECEGVLTDSVIPMLDQARRRVSHGTLNANLRDKVDAELARAAA